MPVREHLRRALAHAVSESARHLSRIRPTPTSHSHVKKVGIDGRRTGDLLDKILH